MILRIDLDGYVFLRENVNRALVREFNVQEHQTPKESASHLADSRFRLREFDFGASCRGYHVEIDVTDERDINYRYRHYIAPPGVIRILADSGECIQRCE